MTLYLDCATERAESCNPGVVATASPRTFYDPSDPPTYFGYGALDSLVPPQQIASLAQAYADAGKGNAAFLDVVDGFGHDPIHGVNMNALDAFLDGLASAEE